MQNVQLPRWRTGGALIGYPSLITSLATCVSRIGRLARTTRPVTVFGEGLEHLVVKDQEIVVQAAPWLVAVAGCAELIRMCSCSHHGELPISWA